MARHAAQVHLGGLKEQQVVVRRAKVDQRRGGLLWPRTSVIDEHPAHDTAKGKRERDLADDAEAMTRGGRQSGERHVHGQGRRPAGRTIVGRVQTSMDGAAGFSGGLPPRFQQARGL